MSDTITSTYLIAHRLTDIGACDCENRFQFYACCVMPQYTIYATSILTDPIGVRYICFTTSIRGAWYHNATERKVARRYHVLRNPTQN